MDVPRALRVVRCSRRISQRELAELAGVPRSTVDRIEAGTTACRVETLARLLAATGYRLAVVDRRRELDLDVRDDLVDRGGRHFPAHLETTPTPDYFDFSQGRSWWGWHCIAWPYNNDWVPENTYWRRPVRFRIDQAASWGEGDQHRVWDDAT